MNKPILFVLAIQPGGRTFQLVRYDDLLNPPAISMDQQGANPKLGLVVAGSSFGDLEAAIIAAIKEAQGRP